MMRMLEPLPEEERERYTKILSELTTHDLIEELLRRGFVAYGDAIYDFRE
jgi:hypothetical protein